MVMMMMMMTVVTTMVMVMVLRQLHVRVLLGLRSVSRVGYLIGGHQHSDRIRNWLKQLRVRAGIQNLRDFLSPRRFHRAYGHKAGNYAHEASSLLIHVHLREKISLMRKDRAGR
jgi:hypothetical protein